MMGVGGVGGEEEGKGDERREGKSGKEGSCVVWINGFVALDIKPLDSVLRGVEWLVYLWWWWGVSF